MEALIHPCQFSFPDDFEFGTKFTNESIYEMIQGIALTLDDTMCRCMWQYAVDSCTKFFTPILTEEGLCFAFNALNSRETYTEE